MDKYNVHNSLDTREGEDSFSIRDYFSRCLRLWKWFLVSVIICCAIGFLYVKTRQPVYERQAAVLIKNQNSGTSSDLTNAFASMGIVTSGSTASNELIQFTSPWLMEEVIERLHLQMNYEQPGTWHPTTLYGTTLPYEVSFPEAGRETGISCRLETLSGGKVRLSDFTRSEGGDEEKFDYTVTLVPGLKAVSTPVGPVVVRPNASYVPGEPISEIIVTRSGMTACIDSYTSRLRGDKHDRDADVIDFAFTDVCRQRASDVLSTLINVYNENWVLDKNQIAVATSKFIHERLGVIEQELGVVDSDISSFKARNLVPDVEEAARLALEGNAKSDQDLLLIENQLQVARYVRDYVANPTYSTQVIPAITGVGDPNLDQQIALYNDLLLDRNALVSNSSERNPLVIDMDRQLSSRRESIIKGVDQAVASLNTAMRNTRASQRQQTGVIAQTPSQAKYLLSVERQQKVKESLYLYLLQKLEECELNQAFTSYNTRVVTPPMGSLRPISPRKTIILGVAFILGLLVPAVIIFIMQSADNKVRSRSDLDGVEMPYAGEIPLDGKVPNRLLAFLRRGRKTQHTEPIEVKVAQGNRDVVNEAFRVLRSNVDFMLDSSNSGADVIMLTSYTPGSGKSYISANLGAAFALRGKRVLLIDCDMRHGSLSHIVGSPQTGLSSYLSGRAADWRKMLRPVEGTENLWVLPVGAVPPNPAELLESHRFAQLMEEVRDEYDYVLADCPPLGVVVDTQIVDRYADRTIFVVRAGCFDKSIVRELNRTYAEKKVTRPCLVLNATAQQHSHYYQYGSSYYGGSYYSK